MGFCRATENAITPLSLEKVSTTLSMNDEKEINRKGDDSLDGNARYHQLLQMVLFEGKYVFSTLCEVAIWTKSFEGAF